MSTIKTKTYSHAAGKDIEVELPVVAIPKDATPTEIDDGFGSEREYYSESLDATAIVKTCNPPPDPGCGPRNRKWQPLQWVYWTRDSEYVAASWVAA